MSRLMPTATRLLLPRQSSSKGSSSGNVINCDGLSGSTCEFINLIADPFASDLFSDAFYASLATSFGLMLLMAALFCFLRPYNNVVYAPRAKHADSKHAPPPVEKSLFGWVPPLIRTKEQHFVEKVGMDAAVFMRFCRMLRNMFLALTIVGCGILIPVYLLAGTAKGVGFFLRLTPQYMYGSRAFWAVVVVAYLFDIIICFFIWTNYRAVIGLRRQYFDSPEYQRSLHARTLLVTDIPNELRSDEGIIHITDHVKASEETPRAAIARNVKDLPDLVEEHEETVRKLEEHLAKYLKNPDKLPANRPTCNVTKNDKSYSKGQKVDAIEYLTSRIKELQIEIKEVRLSVDKRNAMSYGFASYEHIAAAHSVAYVARKGGPRGTILRLAPKPNDLVWKNLKMTKKERNWQNMINNVWVALLTVVWIAPNVLISVFLSNLTHLGLVWPAFNNNLKHHRVWWAIVQGVAAPAITNAFYYYLPAIFRRLCVSAGDVTKTSRERHVMHKLYSFFVVNNFILFSLFSAIFGFLAAIIQDSKHDNLWDEIEKQHPVSSIVSTLIQVSPYWISWLLQRNLGAAVDLSQLTTLLWRSIQRRFLSPTPRNLIELSAPQPFDYAGYYNYFLFYTTVAICIAPLQPLALPVTAFYFFIDSFLKKYLLLYIFITKYESGGMFWRALINRVLFATLLGNVVVALVVATQGDFQANWAMLAALGPLPFLVIGFKFYLMRTFDGSMHYYQKGKAMEDSEYMASSEHKKRKGDRVGVRFGHPVLYKPLMTPMVSAKAQYMLKDINPGRTSTDDTGTVAGYSDIYMDSLDANKPGKPSQNTPFEIVNENQMDFEHYKNRPEFRDEAGGDGELFGRAQDIIRPGTPGSMTSVARTGTWETTDSRRRSESRDSDRAKVNNETEYPRGYHMTPAALREQSPAGSDSSMDAGGGRKLANKKSRQRLVASAARMGRSQPPTLPTPYAPSQGGYGPIRTFGKTPGDGQENTSYDYFKQNRRNM